MGQGDATLITNGNFQMLIDGGPNNRVLSCLGKYIPFWDRNIEVVVLTHPDSDHYVGLIEVFRRYNVINFLGTEVNKDNASYQEFKKAVFAENTNIKLVRAEDTIKYGSLNAEVLSPDKDRLALMEDTKVLGSMNIDDSESNSYSVVMEISYGNFEALITGDLTPAYADALVQKSKVSEVEYLQVPHHGSKNGLTQNFLEKASPEIAVISAGKNNRYGHPHEEILKILAGYKVLGTYDYGDIIVESDGAVWKQVR